MHKKTSLKILQWNVWYEANFLDIIEYLEKIDADIICLQELTCDSSYNPGIDIPRHLANRLNLASFYEQCRYSRIFRTFYYDGNGIFSKFPIVSRKTEILSQGGWEVAIHREISRRYLEATIDIPGRVSPMTVATTHLSWFLPTRGHAAMRTHEARRLRESVGENRKDYVLTGDFNAGPDFPTVKHMIELLKPAETNFKNPTWISKRYKRIGMHRRLDYVFTSPDLLVTNIDILPQGPSDHCPMLLEIAI